MDAYEARLKPNQTFEERYRAYPCPELETKRLEIFQKMIEGTQALLDKQLNQNKGNGDQLQNQTKTDMGQVLNGSGNLVSETETKTRKSQKSKRNKRRASRKRTTILPPPMELSEFTPIHREERVPVSIPEEVEQEDWMKSLWDEILEANAKKEDEGRAPMPMIDLDKKQAPMDNVSRYLMDGPTPNQAVSSKASTFKELPSFVGDDESDGDVKKVPTQYKPSPQMIDSTNLQALLSTPVKVSLPLADVLKVRPELWQEVVKCMKKMGIETPVNECFDDADNQEHIKRAGCAPVPLNKVGDYCEGDDGNTTLPVEYKGVRSLAILDSGAGVAIATKQVWEAWGKPALRKTRMKL